MKFLINFFEILLLFVASYLLTSVLWKVLAILGVVSLSVVLIKNFLFVFFIMLFMFFLREVSKFTLGIAIVVSYIFLLVLIAISPGALNVVIY